MKRLWKRWRSQILLYLFLTILFAIILLFGDYIKANSDTLMVVITFVYVVATAEICRANIKSADATREQLIESKKQFEETNRPHMSCQYILENRVLCGIRFYNYGSKPAHNVTFKIDQGFFEIIEYRESFSKLNTAEYLFGINQHFDFYFSSVSYFNQQAKCQFRVIISYSCDGKDYTNEVVIHFEKQLPVESTDAFEDKLLKVVKEQNDQLSQIADKIEIKEKPNV